MKKYLSIIAAILLLTNISSASTNNIKSKLNNAASEYIENRFMNGVYRIEDGKSVLLKGANGHASIEEKRNLIENEIMPIASATKTFTAVCILKLQERGLLNVHDKISKHLGKDSDIWKDGKMPAWADVLTIHNLLTHRSGLAEYFFKAKLDEKKLHNEINKDIANYAAGKELSMTPGQKHDYNNTNFVLLGLIIEKVSGSSLNDFYVNNIFKPLNLKNTRLIGKDEAIKGQKDPASEPAPWRYFITPAGTKQPMINPAKAPILMFPFADGGIASTTEDLIKWLKALHGGKVLSKASYKQMTTGYYDVPSKTGVSSKMGYGVYISTLENGNKVYHHAGNAMAIRSESGYIPAKNLYYAVLSNMMVYIPKEQKHALDINAPENKLDIIHFIKHLHNAIK